MLKVGYMKERLKMKDKELKRVDWYNEELDKFYDTDKDNKGFIYGIYYYDGENFIDVQWLKTEEERERQIKLYKRSDER